MKENAVSDAVVYEGGGVCVCVRTHRERLAEEQTVAS